MALITPAKRVELSKPGTPVLGEVPLIVVDRIDFEDELPWPLEADGAGSSLSRITSTAFGNIVSNWGASPLNGTPGLTNTFIDHTPPSAPSGLVGSVTGPSTISLDWTAAADPESGIDHYRVYRNGTFLADADTDAFADTTAVAGTAYSYEVSAVNPSDRESSHTPRHDADHDLRDDFAVAPVEERSSDLQRAPVVEASAEDPARYQLTGGVIVLDAQMQPGRHEGRPHHDVDSAGHELYVDGVGHWWRRWAVASRQLDASLPASRLSGTSGTFAT